ncbi:hypothetical protein BX666DRAFT_1853695 [Dichotomocladium elegans]|nr:hypothetical protein BX666DRAFT_1853695 [Dichotomocladium elegans]
MSAEPNNTAVFEAFAKYNFDNDERFKSGMAAILNRADEEDSATREETRERAKWFYYNKFIETFDYDAYVAWKSSAKSTSQEEKKDESKEELADDAQKPTRFTFQELVEMIETGQEIPGIRQIPNKLNDGEPSRPKLSARRKPWELVNDE